MNPALLYWQGVHIRIKQRHKDVTGNIHLLPFYWITRILISFMVAVEMPISFVYTTRLAVQFQQVSVARYAKV
ncbi:hypothetical protein DW047_22545 [Phocaeicola vulgatus]|uniref:Uncharacterized protein n=1 Tax=Phocaeicola vulgatus TaxID=821 RepID=A0A395UQN3_PHOVU|nr:hypothetical protein DWY53_04675 [Phocaeicola vulgatus]RGX14277.1 hypothetical protein DWV33_14340 [Phocaeicola vulgatus]RHK73656.1 hypothetical protein DW047_22545 [Phocaeicola vulgatus]RHL59393.1 hypothetical protein DW013_06500 [Phocaeicola vulgatus]DAO75997.1 MAG TPA: hypothetical protein [Caudoviricetes sp.]